MGIISDSYTLATEILARRLDMDFHVANRLEVRSGIMTGVLKMPMGWQKIGCSCKQSVCKYYHLIRMADKYGVRLSNTIAVGDSKLDLCMIRNAGLGIWFNPMETKLPRREEHILRVKDLRTILRYL